MAGNDRSGRRVSTKQVLVIVLVLLVLVLAIANSGRVPLDYVVGTVEVRLFVVIVVSALVGWLIGWFMGRSRASS